MFYLIRNKKTQTPIWKLSYHYENPYSTTLGWVEVKLNKNKEVKLNKNTYYEGGSKSFGLTYKSRTKRKMLRGIYSAICGEVNVSVSVCVEIKGDYTEK